MDTSSRIFFIILFFGSIWLLLDLYAGKKYLKNIAAATADAIRQGG